jgi:hypothetical protein
MGSDVMAGLHAGKCDEVTPANERVFTVLQFRAALGTRSTTTEGD